MHTNTISRLLVLACDLDRRGLHQHADELTQIIASGQSSVRIAQQQQTPNINQQTQGTLPQQNQAPYPPESNVLGNKASDFFNAVGAWTNSTIFQNPNNNIDMLWRRVVGLRQDIDANAEINNDLRQALVAQLDAIVRLIQPYAHTQVASVSDPTLRWASVRDLSGLQGMFESLDGLAQQTLGDINPPLLAQIRPGIAACQHFLAQYQQGIGSGYAANYRALQSQQPGVATNLGVEEPPTTDLQKSKTSSGDWYQYNGTTKQIFEARCMAWANVHGGISALVEHLKAAGVPRNVISEVCQRF